MKHLIGIIIGFVVDVFVFILFFVLFYFIFKTKKSLSYYSADLFLVGSFNGIVS